MILDHFFQTMGSQVQELTGYLWKDPSLGRMQDRCDLLQRDLRERIPHLVRQRGILEELRHQVAGREKHAALLASRVETYLHVCDQDNAWRFALELEEFRKVLRQDHVELDRQEKRYHAHLADIDQIKHRLTSLQQEINLKR